MSMMMRMEVDMFLTVVFVLVGVDFCFEGLMQSPDADSHQHHAYQAFAHGRKPGHGD